MQRGCLRQPLSFCNVCMDTLLFAGRFHLASGNVRGCHRLTGLLHLDELGHHPAGILIQTKKHEDVVGV